MFRGIFVVRKYILAVCLGVLILFGKMIYRKGLICHFFSIRAFNSVCIIFVNNHWVEMKEKILFGIKERTKEYYTNAGIWYQQAYRTPQCLVYRIGRPIQQPKSIRAL